MNKAGLMQLYTSVTSKDNWHCQNILRAVLTAPAKMYKPKLEILKFQNKNLKFKDLN